MTDQKIEYTSIMIKFANGDVAFINRKYVNKISVWGKHEILECVDDELTVKSVCSDFVLALNKYFKMNVFDENKKEKRVNALERIKKLDVHSIVIRGEDYELPPLLVPYNTKKECQTVVFDKDRVILRCAIPDTVWFLSEHIYPLAYYQ